MQKISEIRPCPYVNTPLSENDNVSFMLKKYEHYSDFVLFEDGKPTRCFRFEETHQPDDCPEGWLWVKQPITEMAQEETDYWKANQPTKCESSQPDEITHDLLGRYECLRKMCLQAGNFHPDEEMVCHQSAEKAHPRWRLGNVEVEALRLVDDMALALRLPKRESVEHHLIDLIKREIQNIKDGAQSWEGLAIITKTMPEATPNDLSARYKEHGEKLKAWADRLEYELELILVPL